MAESYYPGHSDKVEPQAWGEGRQNDQQGTGAVDVVLCADVEGYAHGSQISVPNERANWLVAEGFAAFAEDYKQAFPDYVPVQVRQDDEADDGDEEAPEPDEGDPDPGED